MRFVNNCAVASLLSIALAGLPPSLLVGKGAPGQEKKVKVRDVGGEEREDYFAKWLKQDVVYIITDEERGVFKALTTDEEKENFIEQFWHRRDPDPRTAENEFKAEHYRRIAYANEKFTSGDPGWMTDRGRIYIIHGPPDSLESRPDGGTYVRPIEEGGGVTAVYPYEKWRYKYIEGLGSDVELEFVDPTNSGEFHLAVFPWEKDALTFVPGGGKTLAEQIRLSTRADRPGLIPAAGGAGYGAQSMFMRVKDTPFARYELNARIQAAPLNKYKDLKELVQVRIGYENLPVEIREDYFRLNDRQVLVPITVQVRNKDLAFEPKGEVHVARMAIYGLVTSMTNRVIAEFEDDFTTTLRQEELQKGLLKASVYQKVIPVDLNRRYKVDLVVKDLHSGHVGSLKKAIIPPAYKDDLNASSLLLSDRVQPLESIPVEEEMFVLGDVRVLPNLGKRFTPQMPLGLYFQVYDVALDQTTLTPSLRVAYKLFKDGRLLRMATDEEGQSTQFFSSRRVVLVKNLSLEGLQTGTYQVQVEVLDRINNRSVRLSDIFKIVNEAQLLTED
ncbi:MAG: GWxTD domain-containing protein [Acidobacteriota bacterium]